MRLRRKIITELGFGNFYEESRGDGPSPCGALTADPGTGVMRHADAGYDLAVDTANERDVDLPMVNG